MTERTVKDKVRDLILDVKGIISNEVKQSKFDFAYQIKFPNEKSPTFLIVKPKNETYLEISNGTKFSPQHKAGFERLDNVKKNKFLSQLRNIIHSHKLLTQLKIDKEIILIIQIDKLFFKKNIALNTFFEKLMNILSSVSRVLNYINVYFSEDIDLKSDDSIDPGLYS